MLTSRKWYNSLIDGLPSTPEEPARCPARPSSSPVAAFSARGAFAVGGWSLADLYRLRAVAGQEVPKDTAVILLWLPGGPPHMETYDLKPDAPSDYRGDFKPIPTVVPGLDVCEHLPLHAKLADKFTIVRSSRA